MPIERKAFLQKIDGQKYMKIMEFPNAVYSHDHSKCLYESIVFEKERCKVR
jgi:hypothetical protein